MGGSQSHVGRTSDARNGSCGLLKNIKEFGSPALGSLPRDTPLVP